MNQVWRFFKLDTGEVLSHSMQLPDAATVAANTPPGCGAVSLLIDHLSQRVQLVTDDFGNALPVLVDWQPPAPADDELRTWSWSAGMRRWVPAPTLAALKLQASEPLLAALASLDARVIRPSSEIAVAQALGQAVPEAATLRLSGLLAEKEALRHLLRQIQAATTKEELDALPRYEGPHDESAL